MSMHAKMTLSGILDALDKTRQAGNTVALAGAVLSPAVPHRSSVHVVCTSQDHSRNTMRTLQNMGDRVPGNHVLKLSELRTVGRSTLLLFDNYTGYTVARDAHARISELEGQLKDAEGRVQALARSVQEGVRVIEHLEHRVEQQGKYRDAAEQLWALLDNIDTAMDQVKFGSPDSLLSLISVYVGKRQSIMEGDGYTLSEPFQKHPNNSPPISEDTKVLMGSVPCNDLSAFGGGMFSRVKEAPDAD